MFTEGLLEGWEKDETNKGIPYYVKLVDYIFVDKICIFSCDFAKLTILYICIYMYVIYL